MARNAPRVRTRRRSSAKVGGAGAPAGRAVSAVSAVSDMRESVP